MNEVPNDQEVPLIPHLLDHFYFRRQAAFVLGEWMAQRALPRKPLQILHARGKPLPRHFLEVAPGGMALGDLEFRKGILDAFNSGVTSCRDIHRPAERIGELSKYLRQLRRALEIKLVGRELHAVRVAHRLARLDAKQDFLRVRVLVMKVVAIVGGYQRNAGLLGKANEFSIDTLLDFQALILDFQEKIAFPENIAKPVGILAGLVVLFFNNSLSHGAAQTRRKSD